MRRNVSENNRLKVLAVGKCLKCGSSKRLTVDHVVPISKGGSNTLLNLQCLCYGCNRQKGANTKDYRK